MTKKTKPANEKEDTLERIVEKGSRSRVYVLSEVGYDTAYFNPDAYRTLVDFMAGDKEVTGIIVDGPVTRLDRPEYLNDQLSYWNRSEEECKSETERIPNREQYRTMMDTQLKILEERMSELKENVPRAKIVLSIDSDDVQYTISAMVNEMLLCQQKKIEDSITALRKKKKEISKEHTSLNRRYEHLDPAEDKAECYNLKRRLSTLKSKVDDLDKKIQDKSDEAKLYREKKVRPAHQYITGSFINQLYSDYQALCDRLGIELITKPSLIGFDSLLIDYAHSRHSTWAALRRREKSLLGSVNGKMDAYQKKLKEAADGAASQGVDVILESGHSGIGYKQLQKVKDTPSETNFKNQSSYDPKIGGDNITVVAALPFEDQERIGRFVKGQEPVRLSGGKAINTRKHAVIDRYNGDGVSGITVITKDAAGIVGTEWIQYNNFVDRSALKQPEEYSIICASSDEHIGSPEEDLIARDGWIELYHNLLKGDRFRGKDAYARGFICGGDAAEANSKKWDHRYHSKRDPTELMRENISLLKCFKPENIEDVVKLAMKMTDDARGGSVESMSVILERVADYYESFLGPTLDGSRLKWAHVSITGNHADDVLRDVGIRESDFFLQRLKAKGIGVYEVGKPDYYKAEPGKDARVFLGSYSSARILNIPDYGLDVDGKTLFGPVNILVQHDPKGSGFTGLVGAGKRVCADVSLGAHTHDNWMKIYRTGDNTFSVAYRLATLQGVSPTEKYYAGSVPRTQAAHCLVMPMKGDFSEKALPAGYLQVVGRSALYGRLEDELKKKK